MTMLHLILVVFHFLVALDVHGPQVPHAPAGGGPGALARDRGGPDGDVPQDVRHHRQRSLAGVRAPDG